MIGIDVPIVLGPMGGASTAELVATVSNAGGLGSYGAFGLSGERILEVTRDIRARTDRPFALNIWIPMDGSDDYLPDESEFARNLAPLAEYFSELGVPLPERPARLYPSFSEQVEAVLEARPAVFSFVFGVPDAHILERARDLGIHMVGTASTVDEARFLEESGVDAVVASGLEAGGHRISFLAAPEESLIGNMSLIPQVADAVAIPVIAAGGMADGRGVAAAMVLGADAVQLGTAFLATDSSGASAPHRERLWGDAARTTTLTRAFSGRLSRGIPNGMSRAVAEGTLPVAPFPLQGWLMSKLKSAAIAQGRTDLFSLWAGQAAPLIRHHDAGELMESLVAETNRHLT